MIDETDLKKLIEEDLAFVSKMTVQEYTLYQKWCEVHRKYPTIKTNTVFGDEESVLEKPEQAKEVIKYL